MKRSVYIIFYLLLISYLCAGCLRHSERQAQQVATNPVKSTEVCKELPVSASNNTCLPITDTAYKPKTLMGSVIGSKHVSTDAHVTISAGDVTLLIDSGAVSNEVEISIIATTEDNSGRIPENLTNLTADGAVYRMLPDGQQFDRDITIAMRYDSTALPYGYTADDIYTFFYNEQRHMWQQVERDSVDTRNQIVYSRTNHFTDYINGVLKVPENSDAMAYTPTSIKDLKAADPMEGITLIAPPEANNMGTANLTYPLTIPAGRHGMQPQLAVSYNSAGGSGILGLGWSLPISEISVDTRRGVPWYSDTLESETYTLDGEVLVTAYTDSNHLIHLSKPAYSTPWKPRSNADTMRFYPRVEGAFRKIERIGTTTDSYYWVVTDKSGVKFFYGETSAACLVDDNGNIAKWCLERVQDTYGNEIRYTYFQRNYGVPRSGNTGRQILLQRINYTAYGLSPMESGKYNVRFIYADGDKIDAVTSARFGFLEADAALLDHIIVDYDNSPIKYYVFGYKYGAFGKTLLCNIIEASSDVYFSQCSNCDGEPYSGFSIFQEPRIEFCGDTGLFDSINQARWERQNDTNSYVYPDAISFFDSCILDTNKYYDHSVDSGISNSPVFSRDVYDRCTEMNSTCVHPAYTEHRFTYSDVPTDMLSDPKYITNADNTIDKIHGPLFVVNGNAGLIEGSGTRSWNVGGAVAAGFGWETWMKSVSLGGSYLYSSSESEGLVSLIDLNGDGFSDKIYKRGDEVYYRLRDNTNQNQFLEEHSVAGISDFLNSTSTNNSWGIEGNVGDESAGGICFGLNWSYGNSATTTYFSDMDGDGLPDIVSKGLVLYNRINENHGDSVFILRRPGVEYVVLSSCGYYDTVYIGEPVDEQLFPNYIDSVYCDTIYKEGPDSTIMEIQCIPYIAPHPYEPNLENVRFWHAPKTGYIHITDSARMRPYTIDPGDGVRLIVQHMDTIIKSDTLQPNANTSFLDTILFVRKGEDIYFRVLSMDTRTSDRLMWNPTIAYCNGPNDTSTSYNTNSVRQYENIFSYEKDFLLSGLQKIKMPFDANVHIEATARDCTGHLPAAPTQLEVLVNGGTVMNFFIDGTPHTDSVNIPLHKSNSIQVRIVADAEINWSNIDSKCRIYLTKNNATDNDSLFPCIDTLSYDDSTLYFFDYYPQIQKLVYREIDDPNTIYMYNDYDVEKFSKYGTMYRHWGQFAYKAPANSNTDVLQRNLLNTVDISSLQVSGQSAYDSLVGGTVLNVDITNQESPASIGSLPAYNPLASSFFIMQPDFKHKCWSAYSDYAYIERGSLSNLPHPAEGRTIAQFDSARYESSMPIYTRGATVVSKESYNSSFGISGTVSAGVPDYGLSASASLTMSESRQTADMLDLNGDGLPDVISEILAQYSQPFGGLSRRKGFIHNGNISGEYSFDTIHGGSYGGSSISMQAEPANSTRHAIKSIKSTVGANTGDTRGHGNSKTTWMDINGDGLPDKVYSDGHLLHYYQNIGYGLLPISTFANGKARHSCSQGISGSISFGVNYEGVLSAFKYENKLNVSITAGLGLSSSNNTTDILTIDLNGDGLPDRLKKYGSIYYIQFNNGNGFGESVAYLVVAKNVDNISYTTDLTGAFTVGVTLGVIPLKFEVNPKGGLSRSLSCTEAQWADMNADGVPDYIWDAGNNKIGVRYSNLGTANQLTQVTLPSGGQYNMTYTLNDDGPESNMRHYVLSSLTVNDNRMQTPDQHRTFIYKRRHYDRIERDDYGYAEVVTVEDSASLSDYRHTVQQFHNKDILFRGLCHNTVVISGNTGDTLSAQRHEYRLFEIASGDLIADSKPGCYGDGFPAILSDSTIYYHDGHRQIISRLRFGYTRFGNIDSVYDDGALNDPDDDYIATTIYDSIGDYIVSSVVDELVYNGNTVYRHRSAVRDATTGDIHTLTFNNNANSNSVYDFRYDIYGNIDTVVYPMNHNGQRFFITYKYDGEIHSLPIETFNAYALKSQAKYDSRWQKPTWTKSVNDAQTKYNYDSQGRLTELFAPLEYGSSHPTIKYEYYNQFSHTDKYWDTCKYWARTLNDNNGSNYIATTTISDGLGRPRVVKKVADVNGQTKRIIGGWSEFDALGRKVREFLPDIEDTSSADSAFCHPLSTPYILFSYDRLDRVTKTIYPDNTVTKNQYAFGDDADGILRMTTTVTDQNGNVSHVFSNVRENNTTTIDPCGATTVFRYDNIGQLTKSISPDGDSTMHVYDMLGRRTDRIHPSSGHTQWKYDAAGNMIVQTQNSGENINYSYHYSRPIHIAYSNRPWNDVWYEYGAAGTGSQAGRLILQQDASGVQAFHYDCMGNVDTNWHTYVMPNSPQTFTLKTAWKYDSWGRVDTIVYPDNEKVVYTYDYGGNLLQINGFKAGINPTAYIENIRYDKFGQRTYQQDGNGVKTYFTYDTLNRRLISMYDSSLAEGLLQKNYYTYDQVGNIINIADSGYTHRNQTFTYDDCNRIISSEGVWTNYDTLNYAANYQYSDAGRLNYKEVIGERLNSNGIYPINYKNHYSYTLRDNPFAVKYIRDELGEEHEFTWDTKGNLLTSHAQTSDTKRYLCWTEDNRLQGYSEYSAETGEMSAWYNYTANGERNLKLTSPQLRMRQNAINNQNTLTLIFPTLYASPLITLNKDGYTKHYFEGANRICSKIGGGFGNVSQTVSESTIPEIAEDYYNQYMGQKEGIHITFELCMGSYIDIDGGVNLYDVLMHEHRRGSEAEPAFYYHSDHLGSAAYLTDDQGQVTQTLNYLPYGEDWVDIRNNLDPNLGQYTFNGKEKDYESGFHYYGARYYWSELLTGWLSVDPMADKYPNISPYAYCSWNPVLLVDPDGEKPRLKFHGQNSMTTFENIVNSGLGGQFYANLTKNGNSSYTFDIVPAKGGGDVSKLNVHQQAFYNELRDCIDSKTRDGKELNYDIDVYYGDKGVHTGNYIKNAIDVADMNQFNELNTGGATKQGKMIHELTEQCKKAYMGNTKGDRMGYEYCHRFAIEAENKVNGNQRSPKDEGKGGHISMQTYTLPNGRKHNVRISTNTAIIKVTQ